ncbi:hypothetical protein GCM10023149_15910 [Mucilaginibacter gynuensis]|uniref:Uncharacterized protein n=1 Tax=Mucilaginibacter gynuensis TaxID=1302236 RepID=A0ABP8G5P2_9SPHI
MEDIIFYATHFVMIICVIAIICVAVVSTERYAKRSNAMLGDSGRRQKKLTVIWRGQPDAEHDDLLNEGSRYPGSRVAAMNLGLEQ